MAYIHRTTWLTVLVGLISHVWIAATYTNKYCASINTASTSANYSTYQSDGACSIFCSGHSYAILQDSACWCSDYTPDSSTTTSLSNCNMSCPGYPDDVCGADSLYTYIFLDKAAAGTKSASPSSSSAATSQSSKTSSTATITDDSTLTVTSDPNSAAKGSSKGLSTGAIVGIAVGAVLAVVGVAALVLFIWWKKRRERQAEAAASDPSPRSSSAGIVSAMASIGEAGRRGSKLIPIDERMEFNATLYNRGDGNPSSDSVGSLRDDVDYSRRVLRTTNPDPPTQP